MNKVGIGLTGLLIASLSCGPASAWMHAGGFGRAAGGGGSWAAEGRRGGTASGGDGSWHADGADGGTASGGVIIERPSASATPMTE